MFLFKRFLLVSSFVTSSFIPAIALAQDVGDLSAIEPLAGLAQESEFVQKSLLSTVGAIGGMLFIILIPVLALVVFAVIALMRIARKTDTPNGWLVVIPPVIPFKVAKFAGMSYWWGLIVFIPVLSFGNEMLYAILAFASACFMVYLWMRICERLGFSKWLGLLMIVPIANLVLLGFLAFSHGSQSGVHQQA